ncbi:MAG: hypothetical protein NZM05_12565 [Chloroherpetonaceae bacterium]|nr:hypothetical protein [Chloroherpetonaceae bacterium]
MIKVKFNWEYDTYKNEYVLSAELMLKIENYVDNSIHEELCSPEIVFGEKLHSHWGEKNMDSLTYRSKTIQLKYKSKPDFVEEEEKIIKSLKDVFSRILERNRKTIAELPPPREVEIIM